MRFDIAAPDGSKISKSALDNISTDDLMQSLFEN